MNFLMLRSNQSAAPDQLPVRESLAEVNHVPKPTTTLEGLIAQEPFADDSSVEYPDGAGTEYGRFGGWGAKRHPKILESHIDVNEDEGWITIPYKELPDDWSEAADTISFRSLDRSFVFPGEQLHVLACLSAYEQDAQIITPFKVAAAMSKNGIGQNTEKQNGNTGHETSPFPGKVEVGLDDQDVDNSSDNLLKGKTNPQKDVSAGECLLRMEDHKRQTENLLQRFRNSHFFVRIAESDELLWSKRSTVEASPQSSLMEEQFIADGAQTSETAKKAPLSAAIDTGSFDASASGGVARNAIQCCSLSNGDIMVVLQVKVGVEFLKDPVLEILQFEKYQDRLPTSENKENLLSSSKDPWGELLKWLLPLDNSVLPTARSLSPPPMSPSPNIRMQSTKSNYSGSSGSLFGHFRSYSMSSLPANTLPSEPVTDHTSRPNFDLEDWDRFSSQTLLKSEKIESEKLFSFRGVSLEPERFAVRCGLEGIYIPGRRWRRKIEIIQPVEINSFAVECNTDDLLCVQIKNVSPPHTPNIVVYIDAITIIFEEASKGGPPLSLPVACIESGNDHSLPNLALRRGEEHSFILKPATSMWKSLKGPAERSLGSSHSQAVSVASSLQRSNYIAGKWSASPAEHYAILVSCLCNYTESRLFFKQSTNWRPRISRDLMISVASDMSRQTLGSDGRVPQLPVQVLTLQASNLTFEDLTLTVFAPASFTSPPSLVSLSSSSSPMSPFVDSSEYTGRVSGVRRGAVVHGLSSSPPVLENEEHNADDGPRSASFNERVVPISNVLPGHDLGCTHLWLQSRVPLGCVPSQSMATIKLEVLPLTDGIISLDSLQIDVKEKGLTYIPEHSLKINSTSSVATGII